MARDVADKYHDEDDKSSLSSSSTASGRLARPGVTVGVAPTFRSAERAEKRKEFYTKLEEKRRALEAERREQEARMKEEQEAALKEFRKNLFVKAHSVPSFYYEGPPPKVELKKPPVTRAKSPKITRGRSCNEAIRSSMDEHGLCCHCVRHGSDTCKGGNASLIPMKRKSNAVSSKVKDGGMKLAKETPKMCLVS